MENAGTDRYTHTGVRVFVVEDRGLIAAKIAQILRQAGCTVIGPAATLRAGLDLASRESNGVDAALLDIDLRGEPVYPLAEILRSNGIPFLFLTGYGEMVMPAGWRDAPRLEKPIDPACLREAVQRLLTGMPVQDRVSQKPLGNTLALVREAWEAIRRQRDLIMESRIRIWDHETGIRCPHKVERSSS